jgi:GNAT superfamily N-acetyltransferase
VKTIIEALPATAPSDPTALPAEWAEWAEEPGRLVRVEEGGMTLGTLHAAVVGRHEAWFEGLWVRPAARGRGVGRRLVVEAEALVREHGITIVRTAVPARDYGALAVAERTGFVRHSEASVLLGDVGRGQIDLPYEAPVAPATRADLQHVSGLIAGSPFLAGWRGLVPLGWRFRQLVPEMLLGLIKDGRVLRTDQGGAWFAIADGTAVLSVLTGPPEHRQALFGAVVERALGAGARRIALFVPDAEVARPLRAALAPHPWCPDGLVIVEKALRGR